MKRKLAKKELKMSETIHTIDINMNRLILVEENNTDRKTNNQKFKTSC